MCFLLLYQCEIVILRRKKRPQNSSMKLSSNLICVGHYLASKIIYGCCVSIYLSIYYSLTLICFCLFFVAHTFTLYDICINVCLDSNTYKKETLFSFCFVNVRAIYFFQTYIQAYIKKLSVFMYNPFVYYIKQYIYIHIINVVSFFRS
jgi:hypothetical protein